MRIIILSQYYDPEPVIYPHQLAKGLSELGHEVAIITGFPNYPKGEIYPGYRQRLWQREKIDGINVLRLPLYPDHSLSYLRRAFYYLSFAFSSAILGPLLGGPADIIFVFHPITLGVSAWLIGRHRNVPFVYNVQDMYPESIMAGNISDKSITYSAIEKLAKFVYRKASAVSVISPGFKSNLIMKGVPESKIYIIHNWADDKIYMPVSRDEKLAEEYGLDGRFNVIYAGNMGPPQGIGNVIEAATMLEDLTDFQFVLIGDGIENARLEKSAKDLNLRNVRFISRQPSSKMPFFYALADVLLVHLIDNPLFGITIPSKTQSYLACGRLILMSVAGDAAALIMQAGAGITARPSDPADLARAVRELYATPLAERKKMGESGRNFYLKNLTSELQIEKYENLFMTIVKRKRSDKK